MGEIVKHQDAMPTAMRMSEEELVDVLQSSVYPGAKLGSIKMVINVCRASGKDPLKKPYHIVPMQVSTGKKNEKGYDQKEWRDVIMPGINDYRTDAARTGQHAGTLDPEFGPDVTEKLGGVEITYPKWCRVSVQRRLPTGETVVFSAVEFWKENYATAGRDNDAPNAMWRRRPYAQLSKCAEAQALRKGFPEVGSQPTADEMEGKEIDVGSASIVPDVPPPAKPEYTQLDADMPKMVQAIQSGKRTTAQIISNLESKYTVPESVKDRITAIPSESVIDAEFISEMESHENH